MLLQQQAGRVAIIEAISPVGLRALDPLHRLRADKAHIHDEDDHALRGRRLTTRNAATGNHANDAMDRGKTRRLVGMDMPEFLLDPATQKLFEEVAPNALAPEFIFRENDEGGVFKVYITEDEHDAGLKNPEDADEVLYTTIWGYGSKRDEATWPGKTFEVQTNQRIKVHWFNKLGRPSEDGYLLTNAEGRSVIDKSLHWAYSHDETYEDYTIENHGTPTVPHLHGGFTESMYDGLPEFFFTEFGSGSTAILGPQYETNKYTYDNDQKAGALWYHDHVLGMTRLNVNAGMAGLYIIRDNDDPGKRGNTMHLPAYPYEVALAIQDRMFKTDGEFFYPTYFQDGGPTALAEFFGDYM